MIKNLLARFRKSGKVETDISGARLHLYALPADFGDSILIQFVGKDEKDHYIWIDGGLVSTYEQSGKAVLSAIANREESVDLLVVTHVDRDHIGGVLALARDNDAPHEHVKQYWFNASRNLAQHFNTRHHPDREVALNQETSRSIEQGMKLESFLQRENKWHQKPIMGLGITQLHGMDIIVLGPNEESLKSLADRWEDELAEKALDRSLEPSQTRESLEALAEAPFREDNSKANQSSIVLALEYEGYRILLPGDAHPSDLCKALKRLGYTPQNPMVLDALKLSHHGSKGSTSPEFLDLIDCSTYIISTDGSRYGLPHREALARIVMHPRNQKRETRFYFNYDNETLRQVFSEEEIKTHRIRCIYPKQASLGAVLSY